MCFIVTFCINKNNILLTSEMLAVNIYSIHLECPLCKFNFETWSMLLHGLHTLNGLLEESRSLKNRFILVFIRQRFGRSELWLDWFLKNHLWNSIFLKNQKEICMTTILIACQFTAAFIFLVFKNKIGENWPTCNVMLFSSRSDKSYRHNLVSIKQEP